MNVYTLPELYHQRKGYIVLSYIYWKGVRMYDVGRQGSHGGLWQHFSANNDNTPFFLFIDSDNY